MILFRPRTTDRDRADEDRPTVPLWSLEAVCDTEAEALEVIERFVDPAVRRRPATGSRLAAG